MNDCIFSIIISVLNGRETLEPCLKSIIAQTLDCKHWEIIVIDGGSTDGTLEILEKYQKAISYIISERDQGIYDAWNKALPHVRGAWCLFLGCDDLLTNQEVLERVNNNLDKVPEDALFFYGKVNIVNECGQFVNHAGEPWENIQKKFYQVMCIPHQGVFHSRRLFERFGKFNHQMKIAGDYDMLLRAVLGGSRPVFLPDVTVANWRYGGVSSSPKFRWRALKEFKQIRKSYRLTWWAPTLLQYYFKSAVKIAMIRIQQKFSRC